MQDILSPIPGPSSQDHGSVPTISDIHSGVFPTPALPFDVSLLQFETIYSSWKEPLQWDQENKHEIDKLLREVEIYAVRTGMTIIKLANSDMVYPVSTLQSLSGGTRLTLANAVGAAEDMRLYLCPSLGISF